MWRLTVIVAIFTLSIAWLYFLATHAPEDDEQTFNFPSSLEELQNTSAKLAEMLSKSGRLRSSYVLTLFASAYLFKQTFAIPGSVFLNLLAGAVFGLPTAFALTCLLTAMGATFCYSLARFAGRQAAQRFFPKRLSQLSQMLHENENRLPYLLLSLRLFPMSPNWALNMSCGVLGVPIVPFFLTVLIGLMPYNYICVTTGVLLSKLTSVSDVLTLSTMLQLTGVAAAAVLPAVLVKKRPKSI